MQHPADAWNAGTLHCQGPRTHAHALQVPPMWLVDLVCAALPQSMLSWTLASFLMLPSSCAPATGMRACACSTAVTSRSVIPVAGYSLTC
eukprot:3514941-Prymnesium_polylepis.1